jgi:hypothetical protein
VVVTSIRIHILEDVVQEDLGEGLHVGRQVEAVAVEDVVVADAIVAGPDDGR